MENIYKCDEDIGQDLNIPHSVLIQHIDSGCVENKGVVELCKTVRRRNHSQGLMVNGGMFDTYLLDLIVTLCTKLCLPKQIKTKSKTISKQQRKLKKKSKKLAKEFTKLYKTK